MKIKWIEQLEEDLNSLSIYGNKNYINLAASHDFGGILRFLRLETERGQVTLPMIIKSVGRGVYEGSSPYGYSGVNGRWDLDEEEFEELSEFLKTSNIIAVFIRHYPLVNDANLKTKKHLTLDRHTYAFCFSEAKAFPQLIQCFKKKVRWEIKKGLDHIGAIVINSIRNISYEDLYMICDTNDETKVTSHSYSSILYKDLYKKLKDESQRES